MPLAAAEPRVYDGDAELRDVLAHRTPLLLA
jgi:hypothetical protein